MHCTKEGSTIRIKETTYVNSTTDEKVNARFSLPSPPVLHLIQRGRLRDAIWVYGQET